MPKDFGPPERAPALPRKQTLVYNFFFFFSKSSVFYGLSFSFWYIWASPIVLLFNILLLWLGGLSGIGLGLGPGGQPIDANQLNRGGGGMGNMGPGGNQSDASKTFELLHLKWMTNNRSSCRNGWHGIWKHGRRTDGGRYITFLVPASLLQLIESTFELLGCWSIL